MNQLFMVDIGGRYPLNLLAMVVSLYDRNKTNGVFCDAGPQYVVKWPMSMGKLSWRDIAEAIVLMKCTFFNALSDLGDCRVEGLTVGYSFFSQ